MDKIHLNNQVVHMRDFVKQAKIHIIHKYSKEAKLLQARKGDENKVQKCKRKAERLLKEISIIQKMKPDFVSKKALSPTIEWKNILQQKTVSLEDRCLALLATSKSVQSEVEKFQAKYSHLIPKIESLFEEMEVNRLQIKSKLSSAPQKLLKNNQTKLCSTLSSTSANLKSENMITVDSLKACIESGCDKLPKNKQKSSTQGEEISSALKPSNCKFNATVESITKNEFDSSKLNDNQFEKSNDSDLKDKAEKCPPETYAMNDNESVFSNHKVDVLGQRPDEKCCRKGPKAVALLNLNELEGLDEILLDDSGSASESEEDTLKDGYHTEDTFFLNHSRLSSENSAEEDSDFRSIDKTRNSSAYAQITKTSVNDVKNNLPQKFKRMESNSSFTRPSYYALHDQTWKSSFKTNFFNRRESRNQSSNFQNKCQNIPKRKIFERKLSVENARHSKQNKGSKSRTKSAIKDFNTEKPLHPSWEAKKKLKESSSVKFQGKRMVFED